ncbi:uncharacterized protein BP5553_08411 [Venustampulla echinocandica]|uniref:Extracellular membrane protein CFEM domain-containing protein n=1 Tax=Venustampulla echinocandica TaxID=2656787 RepID=A0A370TE47_9HELO|nr:uncharacterized protein BP5553_08411 [Venustampulla echinocandica]RDL32972.1 hypothetical protein BP5553_08411 [Venustampulla echinocandica]
MLAILPVLALFHARGVRAGFEDLVLPRAPVPGGIEDAAALLLHGGSGLVPRAAPAACSTALEFISFCSSVSPGFLTMNPTRQAPCLCYSSAVWRPSVFDGYVSTCASYARTAAPEDYSAISALQGFCSDVGNVKGNGAVVTTPSSPQAAAPTTTKPVPTPVITPKPTAAATTTGLDANIGCVTASVLLSSCLAATRGFTTLPTNSQAACLCYNGNSWAPNSFDSGVQACASYAKTADPEDYSVFAALKSFCSDAGDVRAAASTPVPTPSGSDETTTTTPLTGTAAPTGVAVGGITNTLPGSSPGPTVTVTAGPTNPNSSAPSTGFSSILLGLTCLAMAAALF